MENDKQIKKCKYCQAEISKKAKKCPNCQSDLRQWPERHPILTIIGLLIIIPMFVSLMSSSSSKTSDTNSKQKNIEDQPLLELQSMKCYREYDYFFVEGTVKNISGNSLKNIEAVGNMYQDNGEFVTSDTALIEYNPILSGQTSSFKVMHTDNPAIKKCKVDFKELMGGTINTKDSRAK